MNRAQLSLISAGCFVLLLIIMLLPWWSVDDVKELRGMDKDDMSWFSDRWTAEELKEMFKNVGSDKGTSLNGFRVGGFPLFLFGLLGAAGAALVLLRKSHVVPLDQRQLLFLSVVLWAIALLIAFFSVVGAPSGKTLWGWFAILACAGGGVTAFLATSKKRLKEVPAAPKPAAPASETPAESADQ